MFYPDEAPMTFNTECLQHDNTTQCFVSPLEESGQLQHHRGNQSTPTAPANISIGNMKTATVECDTMFHV